MGDSQTRKSAMLRHLRKQLHQKAKSLADQFDFEMFIIFHFNDKKKASAVYEVSDVIPVMTNDYEDCIVNGAKYQAYSYESCRVLLEKDVVQLHAPRWKSLRRDVRSCTTDVDYFLWPRSDIDRIQCLLSSRWKGEAAAFRPIMCDFLFSKSDYEHQLNQLVPGRERQGLIITNPEQTVFLFVDKHVKQTNGNKVKLFKLSGICIYIPQGRSRSQNLVPATIAQILNASMTDDRFFSGDLEISQVVLVGLIRSVKESFTRIDYELDDMTGPPLEVKHFVDNDETEPDSVRTPTMCHNTYVRVCGHVKSFQGKKSMVAFTIRPVADMNQLTCHLVSVVYAHATSNMSSGAVPVTVTPNIYSGDIGGSMYGLSALHKQIAVVIQKNMSEIGASIAEVSQHLKGVPEKAIRDAVEFLSAEGHIYSTIDDDHFKATDG